MAGQHGFVPCLYMSPTWPEQPQYLPFPCQHSIVRTGSSAGHDMDAILTAHQVLCCPFPLRPAHWKHVGGLFCQSAAAELDEIFHQAHVHVYI